MMVRLWLSPVGDGRYVVAAEFADGTIAPVTLPGSLAKARRLLATLAMVAGLAIDDVGLRAT